MDSLVLNRLSLSDSRLRYGFSGVYSSDKLPKQRKRYRSFIVNTDPAHCKGRHWQAIYFRQDNHCVFSVLMEHDFKKLVVEVQSILYNLEDCNIHFSYAQCHNGNLSNDRADQLTKEAPCEDMNFLMSVLVALEAFN
ncbi:hypothetical protein TNCV_2065551 [Trichonephila clavipes]|nr:hypothetical protein TNCV_2065551 [Trichonephila clavipes]